MAEGAVNTETRAPSTSDKYAKAIYALTYEPPVEPYSEENKRRGLASMYGYAQTLHALLGPRLGPGRHPSMTEAPEVTSAETFQKIEAEQVDLDGQLEKLEADKPMDGDQLRKKYLRKVMKLIQHEGNSEEPLTLSGVAALGILATERTDEAVRISAMNYLLKGPDSLARSTHRVFNKFFPVFISPAAGSSTPTK